ncbi:MAG: hypothetical protein ACK54P_02550, partial [Bacteroidota bacterium]
RREDYFWTCLSGGIRSNDPKHEQVARWFQPGLCGWFLLRTKTHVNIRFCTFRVFTPGVTALPLPKLARGWSRTRKGGWAIAQSPVLTTTITLERLAKRGYESLLDYYLKVRPEQTFMGLSFTS